jgi:hypothetical protein
MATFDDTNPFTITIASAPAGGEMYVKDPGTGNWVLGVPWVKDPGSGNWVEVTTAWVRDAGAWVQVH